MHYQPLPLALIGREVQHGRKQLSAAAVSGMYPRMALDSLLVGHRGCVNHVQFNESGVSLYQTEFQPETLQHL